MNPTEELVLLDLFSGYGGFHVALEQAGFKFKQVYFSEIDKHAIANYSYNFPNAIYARGVEASAEKLRHDGVEKVDFATFGFPCQDLSIAGKRGGLAGKRSGLFFKAVDLCVEFKVPNLIWENVPGLLSSNDGKDIEIVCETLYSAGYFLYFESYNTLWFLPQNRERIFCVCIHISQILSWLNNVSGLNQKLDFCKKIMESYLDFKLQQHLTEHKKPRSQKQHGLNLEYLLEKERIGLTGQKRNRKYLEIISLLPLSDLQSLYQDIQKLQLGKEDMILNLSTLKNLREQAPDIKLDIAIPEENLKFILSIGILLKNLSEENLNQVSMFIILILIKQTMGFPTFSYAEMQMNIELFIIRLNCLYPNLWSEVSSTLIKKKKNTDYVKNTRSAKEDSKENNIAGFGIFRTEAMPNESVGHSRNECSKQIFPVGEDFSGLNERTEQTANIRTITAGGNSGGLHSTMTLLRWQNKKDGVIESELSPTLRSSGGTDIRKSPAIIVRMQGRNPLNHSDRTPGVPTVQILEENARGICNTLTSVQKDNLVIVANTKKGYEMVSDGDSINFSVPNSATRRGRVGKGVAQTLDTSCSQGVITNTNMSGQTFENSHAGTIRASASNNYQLVNKIRRFTPTECERLQGLPDGHTKYGMYPNKPKTKEERLLRRKDPMAYDMQQFQSGNTHKVEISDTQRYKLCGNGVSIPPVKMIASKLYDLNYNPIPQTSKS